VTKPQRRPLVPAVTVEDVARDRRHFPCGIDLLLDPVQLAAIFEAREIILQVRVGHERFDPVSASWRISNLSATDAKEIVRCRGRPQLDPFESNTMMPIGLSIRPFSERRVWLTCVL